MFMIIPDGMHLQDDKYRCVILSSGLIAGKVNLLRNRNDYENRFVRQRGDTIMNMSEIRQRSNSIVHDSIRRENLVRTGAALELMPDVLGSLSVDKRYILKRIEDELRKPTIPPLNAILGIFGLRIIRTNSTISTIDDELESASDLQVADVSAGESSNLLKLNEEALAQATNAIARLLSTVEDDAKRTEEYLKEQNDALHAQVESKDAALSQLNTDLQDGLKTVAERVQYMLSLKGYGSGDAITEQLTELLTDLNMKAVWRANLQDSTSIDSMFITYKYSSIDRLREKPCIFCDGKTLVKGVIFERVDTPES